MKAHRTGFWALISTRLLLTLGFQLQGVILGWLVYDLTKDPWYLGLIGLAEAIPALGIAPFAGWWVDRKNPVWIYRCVVLLYFFSALWLYRAGFENSQGRLTSQAYLYSLYFGAFVTGVGRAFTSPAVYTILPKLVPQSFLSRSSAWMVSVFQISVIVGPAAGGFLFGAGGPLYPFATSLTLFGLALISSSLIPNLGRNQHDPRLGAHSLWAGVKEGFHFVLNHPILFPALMMDMLSVFFGGITAILPMYAREVLGGGPELLGTLRAAPAAGALLMSFYLTARPVRRNAGRVLIAVTAAFGFCILGFAASTSLVPAVGFLFLSGATDAVSMVLRGALIPIYSPDHLRGRISSVNSMFIGSSNELGAFESGTAAAALGLVPSMILGGCVTLAITAYFGVRSKALRELQLRNQG